MKDGLLNVTMCADCGLRYDDPSWTDMVLSHEEWVRLDPTVTAILCMNCMAKRSVTAGFTPQVLGLYGALTFRAANEERWLPINQAPRVHGAMILSTNRHGALEIICWNDSAAGWDDGIYLDAEDDIKWAPEVWMPCPQLPATPHPIAAHSVAGGEGC